jgi:hypothetical protein
MRLCTLTLLLAIVGACRVARPDTSADLSLRASVDVPTGLDSAATERWVAEQGRACRGQFLRLFTEDMIGRRGPDSTVVFRYQRRFTGVQCLTAGDDHAGVSPSLIRNPIDVTR